MISAAPDSDSDSLPEVELRLVGNSHDVLEVRLSSLTQSPLPESEPWLRCVDEGQKNQHIDFPLQLGALLSRFDVTLAAGGGGEATTTTGGGAEPSREVIQFSLSHIQKLLQQRAEEPDVESRPKTKGAISATAQRKKLARDILDKLSLAKSSRRHKMSLWELLELTHPEKWTETREKFSQSSVVSASLHVTQAKTLYHFLTENWGEISRRAHEAVDVEAGALIPTVRGDEGALIPTVRGDEGAGILESISEKTEIHVIVRSRRHLFEIENVIKFGRNNFGWWKNDQTFLQGTKNQLSVLPMIPLPRRDDGIYDWYYDRFLRISRSLFTGVRFADAVLFNFPFSAEERYGKGTGCWFIGPISDQCHSRLYCACDDHIVNGILNEIHGNNSESVSLIICFG